MKVKISSALCCVNHLYRGGVQLHFCTWPPDFCQMYMYKNVQKCTKYVFSCLATRFLPNVHVPKCTKMYKICFFLFGHQIFAKCTCTKMYKICFILFFLFRFQGFPIFCTFFMTINVHGHQIFAKCTLN